MTALLRFLRLHLATWFWLADHRLRYHRNPLIRSLGRAQYVARRYLQGARWIRTADLDGTAGEVCGDVAGVEIQIDFGGACPVQGEGHIWTSPDAEPVTVCYRSRGEHWDVEIGDWYHCERPYLWPQGGWVPAAVSERCIRNAVAKWRGKQ